jgi:hypothetical protein
MVFLSESQEPIFRFTPMLTLEQQALCINHHSQVNHDAIGVWEHKPAAKLHIERDIINRDDASKSVL